MPSLNGMDGQDGFLNQRSRFLGSSKMTRHKIEIKQLFHILSSPKRIGLMLLLPLIVLAHVDFAQAAGSIKFDHIQTGYNLTGAHILTGANPAISRVCSKELPGIALPVTWRVTAWEQRESPPSMLLPLRRAKAAIAPRAGYRHHTAMPGLRLAPA